MLSTLKDALILLSYEAVYSNHFLIFFFIQMYEKDDWVYSLMSNMSIKDNSKKDQDNVLSENK